MDREKILEVKNLKQHFKVGVGKNKFIIRAVDGITFDIHKGEVFGLVGESGCGKTTTGRTIIKLYEATDGEIIFNGHRIGGGVQSNLRNIKLVNRILRSKVLGKKSTFTADQIEKEVTKATPVLMSLGLTNALAAFKTLSIQDSDETFSEKVHEIKKELTNYVNVQNKLVREIREDNKFAGKTKKVMDQIQMVFQDPISSLNPRMTVKEIVAEGLIIQGEKNKKVIEEKVFNILETVGLSREHAFRYPHEFSGGQRQRIGIARALIIEPKLLIADEPISALDVSIQAQVLNLLKRLKEELELTILFVAHDLSVVKYFSDTVAVMYYGKIVELAPSEQLFAHPLHPYTKSLLSAIPLPDPASEKTRTKIDYDPSIHDYMNNPPSMVEIRPGHFILANEAEIIAYNKELNT